MSTLLLHSLCLYCACTNNFFLMIDKRNYAKQNQIISIKYQTFIVRVALSPF
ncbi:hypothetical protein GLYMA_10G291950v4 [Glycine max]|nr:hypothetical protein GLYMA_10G291950v4 [Glycine max]KAH1140639.1 hypothetical protein GYH30_029498 [Glycine max]